MNVIKNEHGVFIVPKPVPAPLRAAVGEVLRNGMRKQRFLQRSLRTNNGAASPARVQKHCAGAGARVV